jgi:diguanylate cyclase (GGDEF)-like protein
VDRYEGLSSNHPAYRTFASLDRRMLNRLFELGRIVETPAGEAILHAGTVGDGVHLVLGGRLAVERAGHRLRELEPGDFFGEAVLFHPDPSLVDVRALSPSAVLSIGRDAVIDYLALYPRFGLAFCALLARETVTQLGQLSEVYVANRVLTEQVESNNDNLRQAITTVEQTARLVSQSPHPVLRVSDAGLLLFANAPADPIVRSWQCTIGGEVPAGWRAIVRGALESGAACSLEAAFGDAVFAMTIVPLPDLGYANLYGQDVTESRRKAALIEHMAHHDDLTGLPNRAGLRERLKAATARGAGGATLILLDVDGLEPIRALFGHLVSDRLLIEAARRLHVAVGAAGVAAKLGGDQFAVLIEATPNTTGPHTTDHDELGAVQAAQHLADQLSVPFEIDTHRLQVGVRCGITLVGGAGDCSEDALKRADLAKHQAPAGAPSPLCLYRGDLERALRDRHLLEVDLLAAIGSDQIGVVFQPKVRLDDGRIIGAEALVRWHHPSRGLVSPDRFIPIAEQTGAIRPLGEQVLRLACAAAAGWRADLHVAVNLSALQLRQADITERIAAILAETGLPAHRLDLEITESLLVEDIEHAIGTLERLRTLGVRLSLDDFGTGYSCLSYLARLKFDKLKIDRSFVIDMHRNEDLRKIAKTIVALGATLEMTVVAEGIELPEQWHYLRELGCTEGQGYLFGRPLAADELAAALTREAEQR